MKHEQRRVNFSRVPPLLPSYKGWGRKCTRSRVRGRRLNATMDGTAVPDQIITIGSRAVFTRRRLYSEPCSMDSESACGDMAALGMDNGLR